MGKTIEAQNDELHRVEEVLHLLNKQAPLTLKQEKFCNSACVERFLKAKGNSVNKAAKHLRNCLSWRDSFHTDHLIADEFSAELTEGMAYVAGHDDQLRPVMIFRIKQDYQKFHSKKLFTRLLVFTLEVAIQTMAKNVEEFVLIFDASFFRSASAFMNTLVATVKIIADYYPRRLHKTFIIDPPSLFSYLWKGMRPFVELSSLIVIISSLEIEESLKYDHSRFMMSSSAKLGSCSSSRFAFTVSHHFDSLKPWYLSLSDHKVGQTNLSHSFIGPRISPLSGRSFSFASPRKGLFPSTPAMIRQSRTPKPSFLLSPSLFFQREYQSSRVEKRHESFAPFIKFYQVPYDEMIYRSKMRPPLGGLISIVSPQLRRKHMSISQRF